jgi:hypothetical protein
MDDHGAGEHPELLHTVLDATGRARTYRGSSTWT